MKTKSHQIQWLVPKINTPTIVHSHFMNRGRLTKYEKKKNENEKQKTKRKRKQTFAREYVMRSKSCV